MDLGRVLRHLNAMDSEAFSGAKIALVCGRRLVTYRRDAKPSIPWPGLWDLPGGGREGAETPAECALREAQEEFGLVLAPDRVHWRRAYPGALAAQCLLVPRRRDHRGGGRRHPLRRRGPVLADDDLR